MVRLDITEIVKAGDQYERDFFSWLSQEGIVWYQEGSNLNYIMTGRSIVDYIIKCYPETKFLNY